MSEPTNRELNEMGAKLGAWLQVGSGKKSFFMTAHKEYWDSGDLPPWRVIMDGLVPAMYEQGYALTLETAWPWEKGDACQATWGEPHDSWDCDDPDLRRAILTAAHRALNHPPARTFRA